MKGSSPLTRGKRGLRGLRGLRERLIPAHAGKTRSSRSSRSSREAHPRSRGENSSMDHIVRSESGSSPLTRGKHTSTRHVTRFSRLIPAHAGKTKSVLMTGVARAAHPRSRGENHERRFGASWRGGSSPLTRGKRSRGYCRDLASGLIPAHAGKTTGSVVPEVMVPAHPRSRGENGVAGRP